MTCPCHGEPAHLIIVEVELKHQIVRSTCHATRLLQPDLSTPKPVFPGEWDVSSPVANPPLSPSTYRSSNPLLSLPLSHLQAALNDVAEVFSIDLEDSSPTPSAVEAIPLDSSNTGLYLKQLSRADPQRQGDVRFLDLTAAVKRGIIPIDLYKTDPGVVPGPGTIFHSPMNRTLQEALVKKPEDLVLDTSGSVGRKLEAMDLNNRASETRQAWMPFNTFNTLMAIARRLVGIRQA
ncbi:hypothetical protein BKA70DRAFT_1232283 [Coprinopsis sp. MPI-PUGE-AT-0042]|nr:hypothetical protein BKA70DRAFT_1232283 [Coprinopsis sp. MPI-PUGE-AT-0042]